ncbi:HelD family protein [Kitasatospora sp. NPDC101155]|uniref:HelD family protein n=1 Tax=Kitasatospora sp. NPDC101155 TaxID=3364097 RepID=UPI0037F7F6A2
MSNPDAETGREQEYVSMLYGRLDELRQQLSERMAAVLKASGGTDQARLERNVTHAMYSGRLAQLEAADHGLCFGRLDLLDHSRLYIGRVGLFEDSEESEPLLVDWRAPAARPFYLATAVNPDGVRLRRHIRERGRVVVDVHDEPLVLDGLDTATAGAGPGGPAGETALLSALNAGRTGRMSDIVETIQAEQDRIIRAEHGGVLVVQGGPGTGKTAVALHRAAYLLYTRRQQLTQRVVLVIGPNPTFLHYIGDVLPALGETSVLLATVGDLYPGVRADAPESAKVAEVKGRLVMAEVIQAAVRDREHVPDEPIEIDYEGQTLTLDPATVTRVRDRARGALLQHNVIRPLVVREITSALADQYADLIGADPFGGPRLLEDEEVEDIRRAMLEDSAVRDVLDLLWPELTPQQLLADLFRSPERLESAAPELDREDRASLLRDEDEEGPWSASDVPLLDEAAELLGEDDRAERLREEAARRRRVEYAQGVLDVAAGSRSLEAEKGEVLTASDLVDAEWLAERTEETDRRTPAERAAAERTWTFGHVIVDEAQELSEMAWRLLMRRCPTKSMTIVGDTAQTGELAGTGSWARVLDPYVAGRWRFEQLTQNYRVPGEIMAVAAEVLAELDPELDAPPSVRDSGEQPWHLRVEPGRLAERLAEVVAREAAGLGGRRLAVIVPDQLLPDLAEAVVAAVPQASVGENPAAPSPVTVVDVKQVKGLEFDSVLIAEPGLIVDDSPRGLNDLYVALTRATQRLGVVHSGELPAALWRLAPLGG